MYEEEKNDITKFSKEVKKEIAETTQMQGSDVEDVLQKYKQLASFHGWLKQKERHNEPIPESREELMQLYRVEKPAFLVPRQHKKTYNKRQMVFSMRRHHT